MNESMQIQRSFYPGRSVLIILFVALIASGCSNRKADDNTNTGDGGQAHQNSEWLQQSSVKIAACQVMPGEGAFEIMLSYLDSAAAEGVDMVVFPEYIAGPFSLPVKETDKVYSILKAAAKYQIYVVIGGWEEFEPGALNSLKKGEFSNTALLIDRQGEVIGKFRKVHPAVGEPPYFWPPLPDQHEALMELGNEFPVFTLDFAKVGIMTCYDGYFPESANMLSLNGAEIVIWINGREGGIEKHLVLSDIQRNYIAMVATNLGPGSGTLIAENYDKFNAYVNETGNHYISSVINLHALRLRRKNSRVHHQRRPDIYGPISQEHETWKIYDSVEE